MPPKFRAMPKLTGVTFNKVAKFGESTPIVIAKPKEDVVSAKPKEAAELIKVVAKPKEDTELIKVVTKPKEVVSSDSSGSSGSSDSSGSSGSSGSSDSSGSSSSSSEAPPIQLAISEKPKPKGPVFKPRAKSVAVIPEGTPAVTSNEWKGEQTVSQFATMLTGPNPVETKIAYDPESKSIKDIAYTSVDSPNFQDFIVQIYRKYSPYLQSLLDEATAAAKADGTIDEPSGVENHVERIKAQRKAVPKEIDRDACKRRNPEKRELFYYQKFVRDYLSRGTPYRGLLLYHGLGSGKTCASIAAAEALYYGGLKKVYILTPATLSNNYRKDIAQCGFYPLRTNNYWQFLKLNSASMKSDIGYSWLINVLGLPTEIIEKQGGGWVATPDKPSNWNSLTPDQRTAIKLQQAAHMEHRFKFIHYNGATPATLSALAEKGVESGETIFDNAVVVIDEVHNLVRTINGTQIGGKPISKIMESIEPREATWSTPLARKTKGYLYPRAYTLYRLLQNAVGAKIVVLSATPMINYAQELAILMNIIGGEQRMAEILIGARGDKVAIEMWAKKRPDVDFFRVEEGAGGATVLNVTPVPFGFSKVVREDGSIRGFVRLPGSDAADVRQSLERNMDKWAASLIVDMKAAGLSIEEKSEKPGRILTFPLMPDDANEFVDHFIDKVTLKILNENILKARASGLVSYYRGGSEELMPREGIKKKVEVPMSDYMFKEYSRARLAEIDNEDSPAIPEPEEGRPFDLYAFTTKNKQTGFLSQSRAACNWVFPEEVPRPSMNAKDQAKLLGVEKEKIVAVDMVAEVEAEQPEMDQEAVEGAVAVADEVVKPEQTALDARLAGILGTLMSGLEAKGDEYLNKGLEQFSPKYTEMIKLIRQSHGPALVYSQFKRLEGLGIFAAALRASDEHYLPLDIQKVGGVWEIPVELMVADRPRYIMYTGDQDREKRRLLLQLYNTDLEELPPKLAAQCRELLGDAVDNRDGRVCRVFMITQSGAEGISLSNTRQVHIMEPYWNNVRLQQVIGRAIRLCSHMNLPWDDRVVDIFTYLSVFSPTQKAEGSKQLMTADKGKTTDEMIYEIAEKKQVLADGLSAIIQSAAVDCQLHYHEHGEKTQCYTFKEGARPMFMYHPNWRKDSGEAVRSAISAASAV